MSVGWVGTQWREAAVIAAKPPPSRDNVLLHLERRSKRKLRPMSSDAAITFEGVRLRLQLVLKCNSIGSAANLYALHRRGGHEFASRFMQVTPANRQATLRRRDLPPARRELGRALPAPDSRLQGGG